MLVSLRWLKRLLGTDLDPTETARVLTAAGLEVESVRDLGLGSKAIVVARVLEFEKHPEADRLNLVKADAGGEPLDIVCGAANLRPGMLVPCALPGAELPGGIKIKRSKIRGRESAGMLCSGRELGLGADHSGILELPEDSVPGEPFDCILEIKVTPNRADCLSMMGIARELSAMTGAKKLLSTTYRSTETLGMPIDKFVKVEVEEKEACPRYTLRYIKDLTVAPSPLWMARSLEAAGLRPINNVVDATNYVMLEHGIPMHAFDFAKLRGGKIVVRYARSGEKLETIDGKIVELLPDDLVIADAERPVALAGVMGGKDSQVTESTTAIALECAYFDPAGIRRTARRHGFQTDSSYRFERGVDRHAVPVSLARAAQIVHDTAKGDLARGFADVHGAIPEPPQIDVNVDRVNRTLSLHLSRSDVAIALRRLGFEIVRSDKDSLVVAAPSYRVDIAIEEDVIEEVARVHGYDAIPETMPGIRARSGATGRSAESFARDARDILSGAGFVEAVNYSFVAEGAAERHGFDPAKQPKLAKPLSQDQSILRPTLLPGLLGNVEHNQRHGADFVALFEIGKTFRPGARVGEAGDETLALGLALAGRTPHNWAAAPREVDFFDLKGALETLAERLGLPAPRLVAPAEGKTFHPGRSAEIAWGDRRVGACGELHPDLALAGRGAEFAYDLRGRVYAAEMDLGAILELAAATRPSFQAIPKFPGSERDLALLVDEALPAGELLAAAASLARPLAEDVALVDLYQRSSSADAAARLPEGKKSVALRLALRDPETTLTEERISETMKNVVDGLAKKFGATLRT